MAMGESLPFYQVAGIWSLTYFITLLPVSVNGLGLAEVTITNLYSILGGISPATSIALALILRIVWMIGSLPGAFFHRRCFSWKRERNQIRRWWWIIKRLNPLFVNGCFCWEEQYFGIFTKVFITETLLFTVIGVCWSCLSLAGVFWLSFLLIRKKSCHLKLEYFS